MGPPLQISCLVVGIHDVVYNSSVALSSSDALSLLLIAMLPPGIVP